MGDYVVDYYRAYLGDTRSLDYTRSSHKIPVHFSCPGKSKLEPPWWCFLHGWWVQICGWL